MKIFLTGSSGMVGRNISNHFQSNNHEILLPSSKEVNLLDFECLDVYIRKNNPDMVIHAAGIVGGIQANVAEPVKFLVSNMQMGLNVLMAAKINKVKRLMNLSSSCIYPKDSQNPLLEEYILTGSLEPTNEGYALAKLASTRLCEYINREDNSFFYKTVIPCNLYGEYDKFNINYSHMVPAVIRKLSEAKKNNLKYIEIWGDGLARREFMYASDFADFVYYAIENFESMPQNINVGTGTDYSINEYYQKIADIIGYKGEFTHDVDKPTGMRQKVIDDTKLKQFGWKHQTTIEQGLKKTYDYFLKEVN